MTRQLFGFTAASRAAGHRAGPAHDGLIGVTMLVLPALLAKYALVGM